MAITVLWLAVAGGLRAQQPLTIATTSLPYFWAGQPVGYGLAASGGTGSYTWSVVAGSLPPGITLLGGGWLGGTPSSTPATYPFTVRVTDAAGANVTQALSLTVSLQLEIDTSPLPAALVGGAYTHSLTVTGGRTPYVWSLGFTSEPLPSGLSLSASGLITGTPTVTGTFTFVAQVTDGDARIDAKQLQISIFGPNLSITTSALPDVDVGNAYSYALNAIGGQPPYSWSVVTGSLPAGLSLTGETIIGTPTLPGGTSNFTIQVRDANNSVSTRSMSLTVFAPVSITTTSLPVAAIGAGYSYQVLAAGGSPPYVWSLEAGSTLPPGLVLGPTGLITGTPTTLGHFSFTLWATDTRMVFGSRLLNLSVSDGLTIITTLVPDAPVGAAYSYDMNATGGQLPYTWSLAAGSGALPEGLGLTSGGRISGTPKVPGTYPFTARVTDNLGAAANQPLSIAVKPAITITTGSLPMAILGVPYSYSLTASGGQPPYTWSIASGGIGGMELRPDGTLLGTPDTVAVANFLVRVTDGVLVGTRLLSLNTTAPLRILTTTLATGAIGQFYAQSLDARGGTPPYFWTLAPGSAPLPAGLDMFLESDRMAGIIRGVPAGPGGTYGFAVRVHDANSLVSTQSLSIRVIADPPLISSISPSSADPGGPSFTLTVNGGNFRPSSVIRWNADLTAVDLQTTLVNSGQLTAHVPASLIASEGSAVVTIFDPEAVDAGGLVFTISVARPSPKISSLSPAATAAGGPNLAMTIRGANFIPLSEVRWDGVGLQSSFISATELSVHLSESLLATPGTAEINVVNPQPGGGVSNILIFTVTGDTAPSVQISLLGGPAPAKQHPVLVSLSQPSFDLVTGRLHLAFTADPMLPPGLDDPAIEFSRGGRTAAFVIPAGGVNADFGGAAPLLQTGTVAGEITLTVSSLRSSGADITPSPAPAASFVIGRQAPTIDSVRIVNLAPASFGIEVVGFATAREITSADFQFAAKPGQTLPAIPTTAALGEIAQNWYQDPASVDFGSQFVYTRTFAIEGATSAIASVAVTLSNNVGNSNTVSATF